MSMAEFFKSRLFFISLGVVIVASTLPLYVSGYILGLLTVAYYFGVFAMAWDLLFGFAGEVNFGPTFLIGVGAYTAGILNSEYGWSVYLCIFLGAMASVIAGFVLALPALRVRGPYFGLTTLVAVLMLQNFIVVFASLTGGEIGLTIPDVITIDPGANYWIALGFMTISAVILYGLSQSPVGLVLQASGQDPVQAGALGFNIVKHKLAAFVVSAFFSGLSGALLVFYFGTASVGTVVDIAVGVQVIVAAVLGGRRTVLGAALGAIFLIVAGEFLRPTGELATFIVSTVALLVILFFPSRMGLGNNGRHQQQSSGSRSPRPDQTLRRSHRRQGPRPRTARRRNFWPDRPERLGQIDRDEDDHGNRTPDRGRSHFPGRKYRRTARAQDRPQGLWHGVSTFTAAQPADRA
jgi:branched-chain amino acid transport system permease protein